MDAFLETYQNLSSSNIESICQVYREDIRFIDPAHEINGIKELMKYFSALYENVDSIAFLFFNPSWSEKNGYVRWEMSYTHNRLNKGLPIRVHGTTYLEFDDNSKVYFHRDYFDIGEMVYEHIPVLGQGIGFIKKRLGK